MTDTTDPNVEVARAIRVQAIVASLVDAGITPSHDRVRRRLPRDFAYDPERDDFSRFTEAVPIELIRLDGEPVMVEQGADAVVEQGADAVVEHDAEPVEDTDVVVGVEPVKPETRLLHVEKTEKIKVDVEQLHARHAALVLATGALRGDLYRLTGARHAARGDLAQAIADFQSHFPRHTPLDVQRDFMATAVAERAAIASGDAPTPNAPTPADSEIDRVASHGTRGGFRRAGTPLRGRRAG